MENKSGYRKITTPAGTTYCVYCEGSGCEKCGGKGYYCPDTEMPKNPTPTRN